MAVVVCTYGRAALVRRTTERLARQTRPPDALFISAPDESHVERLAVPGVPTHYVFGATGAAAQRNRALAALSAGFEIVTFFDDDFLAADEYLQQAAILFSSNPDWTVLTGNVIRDGIGTSGIGFEEAEGILAGAEKMLNGAGEGRDYHSGYGCNMSFRVASIGAERFDERLVLYSWLEDVDFSRRIAHRGRIIRHTGLAGVHMGVKGGRVSGVRLGYSQVINPIYLARKGSYPARIAIAMVGRNLAANLGRVLWPEPWIDRKGRLKGNAFAALDLIRGRLEPERARNL